MTESKRARGWSVGDEVVDDEVGGRAGNSGEEGDSTARLVESTRVRLTEVALVGLDKDGSSEIC